MGRDVFSKRFLLISGGTVTALASVLIITPPQFGTITGLVPPHPLPTPLTRKTTPNTQVSVNPAPVEPTKTSILTATPVKSPTGVTGTFTGNTASTDYGSVQVRIQVVNGKITKATAPLYPTGSFRDQQINSQAIPYLIQETLVAQSANIQGVGGASYTSQGWATSLQSALNKAGL